MEKIIFSLSFSNELILPTELDVFRFAMYAIMKSIGTYSKISFSMIKLKFAESVINLLKLVDLSYRVPSCIT